MGRHRAATIWRPSAKVSGTEITVVSGWLLVHAAAISGSEKKKM
ncbi:MAG TPA: hypothetical protein VF864_12665 [Gemmatimonadales bacterium]